MNRDIAFFGGVFAAGLALSAFLVPSQIELGLMQLKDREYDKARAIYEPLYQRGDHSAQVAIPLIQLYQELGNVEAAIAVSEAFVEAHPDNVAARRKLAGLHLFGQMPEAHVADLEVIARLDPDSAGLHELASLYDFNGRYDDEISVLGQLVERQAAISSDYVTLAYLQAFHQKLTDAVDTMALRTERFPDDGDSNAALLAVSLLMHAHRYDEAYHQAEAWSNRTHNLDDVVLLAAQVSEDGHPAAGLILLEPYMEQADGDHPDLLTELTWLELSTDHGERALDRLVALRQQNRLPPLALPPLVDAALFVGKPQAAFEVLTREDLQELPNESIIALSEAAVAINRFDLARRAMDGLSDDFRRKNPVLMASLAMQLKDVSQAAAWVKVAESSPLLPEDAVALTELLIQLGRPGDALARLDRLVRNRDIVPNVLPHFAASLAAANLGRAALPTMVEARRLMPSFDADRAWAVVALAAGRVQEVNAWLDELRRNGDSTSLQTVYLGARDAHLPAFALLIAKRMAEHDPTLAANTIALVEALGINGRWREAQPLLPAVRANFAADDPRYIEMLTLVYKAGAPVGDELKGYWRARYAKSEGSAKQEAFNALVDIGDYQPVIGELERRAKSDPNEWLSTYADAAIRLGQKNKLIAALEADLDKPAIEEPQADERIELLTMAGGDVAAVPYLRRLADRFGQDWVSAYEESLTRLGRTAEVTAYLEERGHQADLPLAERQDIAGELLDLGDKQGAEAITWELAKDAPPSSDDVSQLLYLWGPRPKGERAAWLVHRLKEASSSADKAAWFDLMVGAELSAAAVEAVDPATLAEGDLDLVKQWADAMSDVQDPGWVANHLKAAMEGDPSPEHLAVYAAAAYDAEDWELAELAYGKLAVARPEDADALRHQADAAIARENAPAARQALKSYLNLMPGDASALRDYGDAAMAEGDSSDARTSWQTGLDNLDQSPAKEEFDNRRLRADLLQRLERRQDAAELYSVLLAERPDDVDLKADLASVHLDAHQSDAAKTLLQSGK